MLKKFGFLFLMVICSHGLMAQNYLSGYSKTNAGEVLQYHSPLPDADKALLVRSEDSTRFIAWETTPVPVDFSGDSLCLLLMAGIDVNSEDPHQWEVLLNDKPYFVIKSPTNTLKKDFYFEELAQGSLRFSTASVDKYGDLSGYLFLTLPVKDFLKGQPIRITVKGEHENSRTWFMVFEYETNTKVQVSAENAVLKSENGGNQILKLELHYFGEPQNAHILLAGKQFTDALNFGYNVFYHKIPRVSEAMEIEVNVELEHALLYNEKVKLFPVPPMNIYLLHHSHVDIGYTHVQEEVEKMQWGYLEKSIQFAEQSSEYAAEASFKWNTEVLWAVDSYLKQANEKQKLKLYEAIREGWIDLNGMYANELTGLCSQEELFRLFARPMSLKGFKIESAMISDIPGYSWGVVNAMAQNGIRYFSCGANRGHRIGSFLEDLADRPFYWVSQSGQDSVLTWIHGEGYSLFHTGLGSVNIPNQLTPEKIFPYLNTLAADGYPYNMTILRYNIGSDNGPPDDELSQKVRDWNTMYETPQLIISTQTKAFGAFEKEYGDSLPSLAGDLTGYWEDGAASSARETALNRKAAAALSQAESVFCMLKADNFPENDFENAWQKVLLYDEHTWGAWNSISEPESPFTLQQWETKKKFAHDADSSAIQLMALALEDRVLKDNQEITSIEVINPNSWARSNWVKLPDVCANWTVEGEPEFTVSALDGSKGNSYFFAREVPAFGSKVFPVTSNLQVPSASIAEVPDFFENDFFIMELNSENGSIKRLFLKQQKLELVDENADFGLNQYIYVEGRDPVKTATAKVVETRILAPNVIWMECAAPGCEKLQTTIFLDKETGNIKFTNLIFKLKDYKPEALRFAFPFQIPDGILRYDLAFAHCIPEQDQLPSSNKNFMAINNFVNISNESFGLTWSSPDAPLIEVGQMMNDPVVFGYVDSLAPSQNFYSYLMNNYWETNYLAAQEGVLSVSYELSFQNKGYDPAAAEKAGLEARMPLLAIGADENRKALKPFIQIENENIVVFANRPVSEGYIVSLHNCGQTAQNTSITGFGKAIYLSNFAGTSRETVNENIIIPAKGIRHLLIVR